jgi:hypothetical protein
MSSRDKIIQVNFNHGLGDCVMFAHQVPLYREAGWCVEIGCQPDKRILFEAAGAETSDVNPEWPFIGWDHPTAQTSNPDSSLVFWNKAGWNLSTRPMPDIGSKETLWKDYAKTQIDISGHIGTDAVRDTELFLSTLPKPWVALHTVGNSFQNAKSLPNALTQDLYSKLLDQMEGTLILLDWDKRVPRLNHYRVRHLTDDWMRIDIPRLLALLERVHLLIGIDSGPFHATRFLDTPALGIFWNEEHHPVKYCLPRRKQAAIVPAKIKRNLSNRARMDYNIVLSEEAMPSAEFIARHAVRMLEGTRYLSEGQLGADLRLQQMVRDWSRGNGNEVSLRMDRDRGWDAILRECRQRFSHPRIVETGCIRTRDDWRGAGNSTILLGEFATLTGGSLISVDLDPRHCELARTAVCDLKVVSVVCSDSVAWLKAESGEIDLLYLDSLDSFAPRSEEHALEEAQAALPRLHERSILAFDDTAYSCGGFKGKGGKAVPYLLKNGWCILHSGYQTVLVRA